MFILNQPAEKGHSQDMDQNLNNKIFLLNFSLPAAFQEHK